MARFAVSLTVVSRAQDNEFFSPAGGITDPLNASSFAADKTAFEAALATLVADGASPTQAHVTAANSAYTTFKADLGTGLPSASDVVVSYNAANVVTKTVLRKALLAALRIVEGSDSLTA